MCVEGVIVAGERTHVRCRKSDRGRERERPHGGRSQGRALAVSDDDVRAPHVKVRV